MQDTYIVIRMGTWAQYALRGLDGGLGFKNKVSFVDPMPPSGDHNYVPDIQEECTDIDQCVAALKAVRPELYDVIYYHYLRNDLKRDDKLSRLGICKKYYYNHIDAAHCLILGWLNDIACDIKIPSIENNLNNLRKTA